MNTSPRDVQDRPIKIFFQAELKELVGDWLIRESNRRQILTPRWSQRNCSYKCSAISQYVISCNLQVHRLKKSKQKKNLQMVPEQEHYEMNPDEEH